MTPALFDEPETEPRTEALGPQACVLRGFARNQAAELIAEVERITAVAPFRQMQTPGGRKMSVALTNCGPLGWVTDHSGYRYSPIDPLSGRPWPAMPARFRALARDAAEAAGFEGFDPDACLINRYLPGAKMGLHQDKDEHDHRWPVVSVSLGVPAMFMFGGNQRSDRATRVPLFDGDVVVWGGVDRLRYHGVLPIKPAAHPLLGERRINFTLRKAG